MIVIQVSFPKWSDHDLDHFFHDLAKSCLSTSETNWSVMKLIIFMINMHSTHSIVYKKCSKNVDSLHFAFLYSHFLLFMIDGG